MLTLTRDQIHSFAMQARTEGKDAKRVLQEFFAKEPLQAAIEAFKKSYSGDKSARDAAVEAETVKFLERFYAPRGIGMNLTAQIADVEGEMAMLAQGPSGNVGPAAGTSQQTAA